MYFKIISNGYILGVGMGAGGTDMAESEYNEIMAIISEKPQGSAMTDYRLTTSLTWEQYEVPAPAPDPDPDAEDSDILEAIGGVL